VYVLAVARAPVGIGGDAGYYHSAANLIAQGHFLDRRILGGVYPTAEHPPLYPLVLAVVAWSGGTALLAQRIASCVIGVGVVLAVALLGRRVAGPRAGWLAGGLAAVFPPLVTADGLVMSEPLFALLVALAVLSALGLLARPTRARAAGLGVLVALATLTRGEGLALLVLLAWPAAVLASPRDRAWRLAAVTLACVVVLAPWVIRNAVAFGRPLIATDSNTLIAGANCPDTYYGHDIGWWSLRCMERARSRVQIERGDASTAAAWRYAGDHAGRLPVVAAVRVLRTFDLFQPFRQGNQEPRRRWVDVVSAPFVWVVLALAIVGFVRLRGAVRWPLMAPIVMVVLVSALGWGIGRFRIGADVTLLVLAAAGVFGRTQRRFRQPPVRQKL
jgi:4-amino-4-deoxy-L-arabinose transferase-like glycosyltransferase